jgi:gliding motility-associated-like protein
MLTVVPIDAQVKFSIPNAFSPDGNNPFLIPKMDGAFEYSLQIYDRWGGMVFETTDPNINWNGLIGNDKEKAPDGVYVYIAKLSDGSNKTNTFTGTVTLTRGTF